jgi:dihydrofolate synthase/folylpolyglutamate synthase
VAAYGSPHLEHYSDCVRVGAQPCREAAIIEAFEAVEAVRGDIPLTAFEFRTLAAIHQLRAHRPGLMVLEVGLGGRLDAVNVLDADVAVVSSIALDHQEWLGDSLESVAAEKCGIARSGRPLVCPDAASLAFVRPHAEALGARLIGPGAGMTMRAGDAGWHLELPGRRLGPLPLPALAGGHQLANAAGAVCAFALAVGEAALDEQAVARAMERVRLKGRLQQLASHPLTVVDVAHNPHACQALASWLAQAPAVSRWRAVCGMYRDKDAEGALAALAPRVGGWYLADLPPPRGGPSARLARALAGRADPAQVFEFRDVEQAWRAARTAAEPDSGLLAFGSFETVRRILALERRGA